MFKNESYDRKEPIIKIESNIRDFLIYGLKQFNTSDN